MKKNKHSLVFGRSWLLSLALALTAVAACSEPARENQPPVADAGPDLQVAWGAPVVLHGRCSDPDPGDEAKLLFAWRLESSPPGSAITSATPEFLRGSDGPDPFFDADLPGAYAVSLQCSDPAGAVSVRATVTATVEAPPPNRVPVVDAGPDATLEVGATVRLQAFASDPDGDPLAYAWVLVSAPAGATVGTADLVGASSAGISIVPDVEGVWTFEVSVDDGQGGGASDQVVVTLVPLEKLAGRLTVTVLAAEDLAPLSGAEVWIDNQKLPGATNAQGQLIEIDAALQGPVTVTAALPGSTSWDHDRDPATAPLLRPVRRMVSVTAVDRPEVTVVLTRTEAGRFEAGRGEVVGAVPAARFEALPAIRPFFSLAGARISGQLKVVLITPLLPRQALSTLDPGLFFAPSGTPRVPLPGNMATDDSFLNDNAALFDRVPGPGGEPPFTRVQMDLPAGPARLFLMEGIATVDMERLLPLLVSGAGVGALGPELGIVMGAIDFTTLSVGLIEVEVPAGGSIDISGALLDSSTWLAQVPIAFSTAQELESLCDPNGACLTLERLRTFAQTSIELGVGALPADPRVAAAMPATSPFEIFCTPPAGGNPTHCDPVQLVDLAVPAGTRTDVPYEVAVALLEIPAGHALLPDGGLALTGYRFARAPGLDPSEIHFSVPALEGAFAGLSYAVSVTATRRAASRLYDGAFFYQPGASVLAALSLAPGARVDFNAGGVLPSFPGLEGAAPLQVEVLFVVEDSTVDPPVVLEASAMVAGAGDGSGGPRLPSTITATFEAGDDFRTLLLRSVDRASAGSDGVPVTTGLWEILYPPEATALALPPLSAADRPLASGEEVWVEAAGWRVAGAYSYRRADPVLQTRRRIVSLRDTFAFQIP